ncbi:MAG: hypothetical protein MJ249_12495 [Kiritimatiellae bacterium]|nr:hypothetical protein [Kiritimatiellia bacterium]
MMTKVMIIVGVSVVSVVGLFVWGQMMCGKEEEADATNASSSDGKKA